MSGKIPAPASIALVRASARAGRAPRIPFGLRSFEAPGTACEAVLVVVEVDTAWPASGYGDTARIAAQVPHARDVAPGTLVVVAEEADGGDAGLLGRILKSRRTHVARAVRCSALLARGYTRLGGGEDPKSRTDLAWGYA
jgi:hypothetical protein